MAQVYVDQILPTRCLSTASFSLKLFAFGRRLITFRLQQRLKPRGRLVELFFLVKESFGEGIGSVFMRGAVCKARVDDIAVVAGLIFEVNLKVIHDYCTYLCLL